MPVKLPNMFLDVILDMQFEELIAVRLNLTLKVGSVNLIQSWSYPIRDEICARHRNSLE